MKSKTQTQNSTKSNPKSKKRKKILIVTLSCALLIPMLSAAIAVATFAAWANTQHVDKSLLPTATALPVYYDISGNELPSEQSDFVEPNEVSDNLKNAFVALEDKRFYKHNGYDVVRMAGALVKNVKAGGIREGASTITQQLVKNTHLTQERTLSRKLKELAIAIQLEKEYDKDEILSMYLSVIYFGNGAYGVKQAANTYFGKSIDELDLSECATLAGIVRNPAKYSPISNAEQCKSRRNITLSVMREQGYIDEETYQNTISLPVLTVKDRPASHDSALRANSCEFYLSQVQNEVCEKLNMTKYQLSNSGLKIYTNLDSTLQAELEKQRLDINNYESDSVSSVSIILDNESGAVLAYSSSYPYNISRQAGSVLKPLAVYAPALDGNYISLATPIVDEKIDFGGFSPSNYGDKYYGDTTVREAIKKSMNSVSVKVLDYIGVDRSESYLRSFGIGIADSDKNYALALGATSKGVSPLSVAGGYSALARDGEYLKPSFVRYVVEDGNKVYTSDSHQNTEIYGSRAVSSATSALITSALVDTVNDGTAKSLSVLPFEVAAKTGTAQRSDGSNSDAWCASYNKQYTVLVWHGNDEGMNERGGGYPTRHAANIWKSVSNMKQVAQIFTYPDSIILKDVDIYSSKINKQVVAATENTPLEYRKSELFAINSLPTPIGSKFESVPEILLDATSSGNIVRLSFDTECIYAYEVYRQDVTGSSLVYSNIGDGNTATVYDRPIGFGGKVEYTVICHLINNEEISSSTTKSLFIDNSLLYSSIA